MSVGAAAAGAARTRCREKAEADDSGNAAGTRWGRVAHISYIRAVTGRNEGDKTCMTCPLLILVVTSDHVRRPFSSLALKRKRELTLGETGGKDEQEGGKPHGRCSLLELSLSLQRQSKGLSAATVAS